ncbi:MAG TPA: hypothetical protein VJ550_16575 [Geomonas sp.]|nr:hypothetical protein [Geomonas sp.]
MTLFSLDGSRQPAVGQRPWWRLFEVFQGSELHSEFRTRILSYSQSAAYIDSAKVGADILAELGKDRPALLETLPASLLPPLFGMTLWNLLASSERSEWLFKMPAAGQHEFDGTEYFVRPANEGIAGRETGTRQ